MRTHILTNAHTQSLTHARSHRSGHFGDCHFISNGSEIYDLRVLVLRPVTYIRSIGWMGIIGATWIFSRARSARGILGRRTCGSAAHDIILQCVNSVASLATHRTPGIPHRVRPLSTSVDQGVGSKIAVHTEMSFKREVRELLSGDNTSTTYVLIMTTFVQVLYWFSGQKTRGTNSNLNF
jgi:hypothetical protein